jgi:type IV fimbrial biogenesis protein FimT
MKSRQRGFNLLELMMGITVMGVLVSLAVPSLRDLTMRQRIVASAQDMQLDLTLARQEAVTRGVPVSVCTSANGTTCSNDGWGQARIVFADLNSNGAIDPNDEPIKYSTALPGGLSAASADAFLTFSPTGSVAAASLINICYSGFVGRNLRIKRTGHPMLEVMTVNCP